MRRRVQGCTNVNGNRISLREQTCISDVQGFGLDKEARGRPSVVLKIAIVSAEMIIACAAGDNIEIAPGYNNVVAIAYSNRIVT